MHKDVYLGFDFGLKRIGVAVGQGLTGSATPLSTLNAKDGVPDWALIQKLLKEWHPKGFVVGLPTAVCGKDLTVTERVRSFAETLQVQFQRPVYLVDERFSTVEARSQLFEQGGFRKIRRTEVDSLAACIILEQWLREGS